MTVGPFENLLNSAYAKGSIYGWQPLVERARKLDAEFDAVEAQRDRLAALVADGIEAFRLTREYVGEYMLPPMPGWSWFDWTEQAEAALAEADVPEGHTNYNTARGGRMTDEQRPCKHGPWAYRGDFQSGVRYCVGCGVDATTLVNAERTRADAAEAQRDRLAAALDRLAKATEAEKVTCHVCGTHITRSAGVDQAILVARAALADVEVKSD